MAYRCCLGLFSCIWLAAVARGGDWPMWRYDAQRGNATPHGLAAKLYLQWQRQLPAPRPAWPDSQTKLQFDAVPQPVVAGQRMFVPCTATDNVAALDTRSGELLWRFFADSPVRFAPIAWKDRVYFVSDDGHLYCLGAADGNLQWKLNGGPAERWIIGNDRLVSSWPARGGPVLYRDKIFFTASIWPFMGIFVHAVDAETGAIVWTNSGDSNNFITHPHGAKAFGTIVPHGHLAATGDGLVAPGGRSTPAVFDVNTGKMNFFYFDGRVGSHQVRAANGVYYTDRTAYDLSDGVRIDSSMPAIIDGSTLIYGDDESIRVEEFGKIANFEGKDKYGKKIKGRRYVHERGQETELEDSPGEVFLKAGSFLYVGGAGGIAVYDLDEAARSDSIEPVGKLEIDGEVLSLLAADDRLFAVTSDAGVYSFGPEKIAVANHPLTATTLPPSADNWSRKAADILRHTKTKNGYCVALGIGTGRLVEELLRQSDLYVIAIDDDEKTIDSFRRKMYDAGLYGKRVSAHVGSPAAFALPQYLANLIVSEQPGDAAISARTFAVLRPYGGVLCLELTDEQHQAFAASVKQGELTRHGQLSLLVRAGALPGSADWTHQYANAAQTSVSKDTLVKAPFGVLWFGGPSNDLVLPRHGHGPSPQVAGGRTFIEGPDALRAIDVYTGRLLWHREIKDFGRYYNTTKHFPGAGEIGSNYVSLPDKVYAVYGDAILELDAASGEQTREFKSPSAEYWGFLAVCDDYLIATLGPLPSVPYGKTVSVTGPLADKYGSGSKRLVVFNRHSGKLLWSRDATLNFRHNNICAGNGKLFCIDSLTEDREKMLLRRGLKFAGTPTMYGLDLESGAELWSTTNNVFGTFLSYSPEHDIVLQAGSYYRDRAKDEVDESMLACRGSDGTVLWHDESISYCGPCMLRKDKIVTNGSSGFELDLRTGKRTGWKFTRMYGCNTAFGSEHLLTFRSGAAGFCDLAGDSGTSNIGGFRSGCTNNLIVANGVLCAPDYTRTCTCAYQNQTSLALVHMPDAEFWTFGGVDRPGQRGFNLGAPGDRRAANGTMWRATGAIDVEPAKPDIFRFHSSQVKGDVPSWIVASGLRGVERLTIETDDDGPYTLRLYFLEPDDVAAGKRIFGVAVQGRTVLQGFDVVKEAGASRTGIMREFPVEPLDDQIVIELSASGNTPTVLCGVELLKPPHPSHPHPQEGRGRGEGVKTGHRR